MINSHPSIYTGYWEGIQAFESGEGLNPYPADDEQHNPWIDGWYDAFDDFLKRTDSV